MSSRQRRADDVAAAAAGEQLTHDEVTLIRQLRQRRRRRAGSAGDDGRLEGLEVITFEGRRYLEMPNGHQPIMVPTHMAVPVHAYIRQNLEMLLQMVPRQLGLSPFASPPGSPAYTGAAAVHPPLSPLEPASAPSVSTLLNGQAAAALPVSAPAQALQQPAGQWDLGPMATASTVTSLFAASSPSAGSVGFPPLPGLPDGGGAPSVFLAGAGHHGPHLGPSPTPDAVDDASASRRRRGGQATRHARSLSAASTFSSLLGTEAGPSRSRVSGQCAHQGMDGGQSDEDDASDGSQSNGSERSSLNKPRNKFIIYRQHTSERLRDKKPKMGVGMMSKIIGDLWKNESDAVKAKYKELADAEKKRYDAKKKLLELKRRKRSENRSGGGGGGGGSKRARSKRARTETQQSIVLSETRDLSSFTPEALAQSASADGFQAMLDLPSGISRSLTVDSLAQADSALVPTVAQLATSMGLGIDRSEPVACYPADAQHQAAAAASSLQHLGAPFSQPLHTTMALEAHAVTEAALQPLTASIGHPSGMEWAVQPTPSQSSLDTAISTLLHKGA